MQGYQHIYQHNRGQPRMTTSRNCAQDAVLGSYSSYRNIFSVTLILLLVTFLSELKSCSAIQPTVTRICPPEEFDEQVRQLIQNVTVSKEKLQKLPKLLYAVEDTLNTVWPGSKAKLLGSLAQGLGSESSDADIAVELPNGQYTEDNDVIDRAATAFKISPHYRHINIIRSPRISVINLHYIPADIYCDVSLKTVVAPYETGLIRHLLQSDERVLNMAILLKHWANIHNVTVKNCQSSVAILLLVIFFMQQRSILPPVIELQKNVKPVILNATERFNVAFESRNISTNNDDSLYELLGDFFEYYTYFDFDRYIISPYLGKAIEKSAFERLETVPEEFHLYKISLKSNITHPLEINTPLCIQAPLTPNNNCAHRVNRELKDWMILNFKIAFDLYKHNRHNMCRFLNALFIERSDKPILCT